MSIIIHGINLPRAEDDWTLELYIDSNGEVEAHTVTGIRTLKAIELPPHGRLGDLDALMAEFERMQTLYERRGHEFACSFMSSSMEISTEWYCVEDAVNAAKTIIPAEGGAGNG